jgi:hypothetical protein
MKFKASTVKLKNIFNILGTSKMNLQAGTSVVPKRCTPAEIAEKRRQAMQRLQKTKAMKTQKT